MGESHLKRLVLLSIILLSACSSVQESSAPSNSPITTAIPTATPEPTPAPTIDPAVQKAAEEKSNADAAAKVIADKAAKDKVDAAIKKAAADKKKKLDAATINLKKKIDEVQEITWLSDKASPVYANRNSFYLYFAQDKDGAVNNLRLNIQYTGDDWVFIDHYIIKTDDKTFNITAGYDEVKRDNNGDGVWEYYDVPLTMETLDIAKAIASSKKTIIRSQGDQHSFDRIVTAQEKSSIKHILDAYEAMDGKFPS
jgi:hypothetical protein